MSQVQAQFWERAVHAVYGGFLALFWFLSFQLGHWLYVNRATLPFRVRGHELPKTLIIWLPAFAAPAWLSLLYAILGHDNPMIVLLAILAIAVASEHLVSLEVHADRMESGSRKISGAITAAKNMVEDLVALNFWLDTRWERHKLTQYAQPGAAISAVVHYWGIEQKWIDAIQDKDPFNFEHLKNAWTEYATDGSYAHAFITNYSGSKHFLTDTNKLGSIPTVHSIKARPDLLGELLGLTWHTVAYWLASFQARDDHLDWKPQWKGRVRSPWIRIGLFPLWVHAIGMDEAYILMPAKPEFNPLEPYFQQPHALVRRYAADEGNVHDLAPVRPSINEIHTRINEEYYQAGSRVVPWLAMAWREILGVTDLEERAADSCTRGLSTLKSQIQALSICGEDFEKGSRVAQSIVFLFLTLLAHEDPARSSESIYERPGADSTIGPFDRFWSTQNANLTSLQMMRQELFL